MECERLDKEPENGVFLTFQKNHLLISELQLPLPRNFLKPFKRILQWIRTHFHSLRFWIYVCKERIWHYSRTLSDVIKLVSGSEPKPSCIKICKISLKYELYLTHHWYCYLLLCDYNRQICCVIIWRNYSWELVLFSVIKITSVMISRP